MRLGQNICKLQSKIYYRSGDRNYTFKGVESLCYFRTDLNNENKSVSEINKRIMPAIEHTLQT